MPKGKRKGRQGEGGGRGEGSLQTSDDESLVDNASVYSGCSENYNGCSDNHSEDQEHDTVALQDMFEEKLSEAIDGLTQKSAQGRTSCFEAVAKALIKKYIPDYLQDRHMTVCDSIERSLRKGKSAEQGAAADLAALLCVQLGAGTVVDEVSRVLRPTLSYVANDNSFVAMARSKCCLSMALVAFFAGGETCDTLELMQQLQQVFSGSYLKGDGSAPNVSAETAALHSSALSAWALLFTLMSPNDVYSIFGNSNRNPSFPTLSQLCGLLNSAHLEVRLSAGESLALIYEAGRDCYEDFGENFEYDLLESLRQMATDSHKYRAKKDRKQQRATFRDILHFIEGDTVPDLQIRFGKETLVLDTWQRRKQYDALCAILGPGLNLHLAENELLRDIFHLGPRVIVPNVTIKHTKLERHLLNAAAFKARTLSRSKNRDKRSDF